MTARPSRPSKNNCQEGSQGDEPGDSVPAELWSRPISVEPGVSLREECVHQLTSGKHATTVRAAFDQWRDWYKGYENSHITFERDDGKTVRKQLENSFQPGYRNRFYAKLKGLEREVEQRYENLTTVMLTFTASHKNANGKPRCPADHMRDIADGFDTARKHLYHVLDGREWEYAKVWEPHKDGLGHLHMAIFIDGEATAEEFEPVLSKYTETVKSAGSDAHRNNPCNQHKGSAGNPWDSAEGSCEECDTPVSVNDNVENLGSYISEYIGVWDDETLNRPVSEQVFYAISWATNTRRVEFSNGAQEMIKADRERQRREETGTTPEDRGGDDGPTWEATEVVIVDDDGDRHGGEPSAGGVNTEVIDGRPELDPEKFVP